MDARGFSKVSKETLGVYAVVVVVEEGQERWDVALLGGGRGREVCIGVGGREDWGDCVIGEVGLEWCFRALRRWAWVWVWSVSIVAGEFFLVEQIGRAHV